MFFLFFYIVNRFKLQLKRQVILKNPPIAEGFLMGK